MDAKFHKDSKNHCPSCGADGNTEEELIDWEIQTNEPPYYKAHCKVCGCDFHEVYKYDTTAYDGPVPRDLSTDKEIEAVKEIGVVLTDKEGGDSENWPEFEVMKDAVVDFMNDLPIELYEHLFGATQQEQDKLTAHLMAYDGKHTIKEKARANFLWPVEKGSVEEAGYEFANARTEPYRYNWWKTLLVRASEIEKLDENL